MNKIMKITLTTSAILLCLSTTGCYEVINKFKEMSSGDKYCIVKLRGYNDDYGKSCYYLDENLSAKQCKQLENTDNIVYTTSKWPYESTKQCTKYKN